MYYAKSKENLLEFHYPECIKNRTNFSYPDNYFTLTYKDVMSLMDDNPISEGVIEFVVDCFNIYIQQTEPSDRPPSNLFGQCYDIQSIVPSPSNYIALDSYFTSSINKTQEEIDNMKKDLKHWFQHDDKDRITDCLSYFHRKFMMISSYSSIFKLNNNDYALCLVKFHKRSNFPNESHAQSLCFNKGHNAELSTVQVWLAKYFGMYFKQQRCIDFTEEDFDGNDIKMALDHPNNLANHSEDSSILSQKSMHYKVPVQDSNNSGIYCLGYFLARLQKINASTIMGKTEKEMKRFAKRFRLCTLSLISSIYELYNEHRYVHFDTHLKLINGDYSIYIISMKIIKCICVNDMCRNFICILNFSIGCH